MQRAPSRQQRSRGTVIPPIAGWRSKGRACSNLAAFGLVMLLGTWIVHQTEYRIEYSRRFAPVMASSPHHLYMAPAGAALLLAGGLFILLCGAALCLSRLRLGRIAPVLPARLSRRLLPVATAASWTLVARTALILSGAQAAVYLLQENLESLAASGTLPGIAVLLAPQHATVIPLHLAAAVCSSLLLWTVAAWLGHARRTLRLARVLLLLTVRGGAVPPRRVSPRCYLPNLRFVAGVFCLRSPPLGV